MQLSKPAARLSRSRCVGGSAAYAAKFFDPGPSSATIWGFAIACIYLIALSILLITRCMQFIGYPAQYQTPRNLLQRNFSLDDLREVELENLTQRIEEAAKINRDRAEALNRVRIAAALSPLIFLLAALLTVFLRQNQWWQALGQWIRWPWA